MVEYLQHQERLNRAIEAARQSVEAANEMTANLSEMLEFSNPQEIHKNRTRMETALHQAKESKKSLYGEADPGMHADIREVKDELDQVILDLEDALETAKDPKRIR